MAWEYFTAPLAAGQELTAEMRAELLAALDERLKAVDATWGVSTGASQVALVGSRLATRRVYYTGPATSGGGVVTEALGQIDAVVAALGQRYQRPAPIETNTGTTGTHVGDEVLATALGSSPAALISSTVDGREYWNMIRAANGLMRWLGLGTVGSSPTWQKTATAIEAGASGLEPVQVLYAAKAESSEGSGRPSQDLLAFISPGGTYSPAYNLSGTRATGPTTVPVPTGLWAGGWVPAVRPSWGRGPLGNEFYGLAADVDVGGVALTLPAAAEIGTAGWVVAGDTSTVTGALSVARQVAGYTDGATFAAMDAAGTWVPQGGGGLEMKAVICELFSADVAGRPTFVYD